MKYDEDRLMRRFRSSHPSRLGTLITIVQTAIALLIVVIAAVLRFANPELTSTQLLIEYWPVWLGMFAILLLMTLTGKRAGRR